MTYTDQENTLRIRKHLSKIPLISTGQPSTLGTYRMLANIIGGDKAVKFIDKKIAESPHGENEAVLAEESQMLYLLANIGRPDDSDSRTTERSQ